MASSDIPKIEAGNLFNVNGLVAVITGGGSGQSLGPRANLSVISSVMVGLALYSHIGRPLTGISHF